MRTIKLKRVVVVVAVLVAVVLLLHVLLAVFLVRSEGAAQRGFVPHVNEGTAQRESPPHVSEEAAQRGSVLHVNEGTAQRESPLSVVQSDPTTVRLLSETLSNPLVTAFGPLGAFLKQCAPDNASRDLYDFYFAKRRLCNEPLLERMVGVTTRSSQEVLFVLRTTAGYHRSRLPVLFDTWLSSAVSATRKVVLMTDARDEKTEDAARRLGLDYVVTRCPPGHNQSQLCCKAGEELETALRPPYDQFEWLCHVDDDMYVLVDVLVDWLSQLEPHRDHVYMGRASEAWNSPQVLRVKEGATSAQPGLPFDFALGGLYCLSRAMLVSISPYLGTAKTFVDVCLDVKEPDDVVYGIVTGAVLRYPMVRTNLIHTHGHNLAATVNPLTLQKQIAVSHGYGEVRWGNAAFNNICVPNAMFNVTEDPSQFRSLHCFLHPMLPWCAQKHQLLLEAPPAVRVRRPGLHCMYW